MQLLTPLIGGEINYTEPNSHPLANFPNSKTRQDDLFTEGHWPAPEGLLYRICGANAYSILPANWTGGMLIGDYPSLLFPTSPSPCDSPSESLGVPVYKDRGLIKKCRYLQIGNWKDDKWPPEWIILYYGPANWAKDGSWGYQTPIYMHNRIIWLQAEVEIFTNEMVIS